METPTDFEKVAQDARSVNQHIPTRFPLRKHNPPRTWPYVVLVVVIMLMVAYAIALLTNN